MNEKYLKLNCAAVVAFLPTLFVTLVTCLTTSVALAGGSSGTGGGHTRLCLTESAAKEVANRLEKNALIPQLAVDPLQTLKPEDVTLIEILDLVESRSLQKSMDSLFIDISSSLTPEKTRRYSFPEDPAGLKIMRASLFEIYERLTVTGKSAFNPKSRDSVILQSIIDVGDNFKWTASESGLSLTDDFDPKVMNPANCIYVQAVRQNLFSERVSVLDYDPRLIALMDNRSLMTLALHEAVYNLVLRAPNYDKLGNPSATTRQITISLLMALAPGANYGDFTIFAEMLEELGYGPYEDMVSPNHNRSLYGPNSKSIRKK